MATNNDCIDLLIAKMNNAPILKHFIVPEFLNNFFTSSSGMMDLLHRRGDISEMRTKTKTIYISMAKHYIHSQDPLALWEKQTSPAASPNSMKKFPIPSSQHGIDNEQEAIETYRERNIHLTVINIPRTIVNSKLSFLAGRIDGLILENNNPVGVLEVKCPYNHKNITIKNACAAADPIFCLDVKGSLKKDHEYYYQCQLYLAITGLDFLDFVVYLSESKSYSCQRICMDINFCVETLNKLSDILTEIIPALQSESEEK